MDKAMIPPSATGIAGGQPLNLLPTFPSTASRRAHSEFEAKTGHKVLCNLP